MAREMRRGVLSSLRFIVRDKTHAARRALSRPWDVIPDVKEGWLIFAGSNGSVVRVIQNSLKNLQMRAHRFNSVARPLGRGILFYEAVVMVAVWCTVHRRSKAEVDCSAVP